MPFGSFINSLQKLDMLEFLDNGIWTAGQVEQVHRDKGLLRAVKVAASGGSIEDKLWIMVEDGRIAPLGTFTIPLSDLIHANGISNGRVASGST